MVRSTKAIRMSKEFGDFVKDIRLKRGMTQQQATMLMGGTSNSTWHELENRGSRPTIERLARIANVFDLNTADRIRLIKYAGYPIDGGKD